MIALAYIAVGLSFGFVIAYIRGMQFVNRELAARKGEMGEGQKSHAG